MTPMIPIALLGFALCMLCMQVADIAMQWNAKTPERAEEGGHRANVVTDWNRILEEVKL